MKRFKFSLERLLEVRQRRMLVAQVDLHGHMVRQRQADDRVAAAEAEIQGVVAEVRDCLAASPTATEVLVADTLMRGMQAALATECLARDQVATTVIQARKAVERRHRDVKIVERLKDRAIGSHRAEMAREQSKAMDEMVLARSRRGTA